MSKNVKRIIIDSSITLLCVAFIIGIFVYFKQKSISSDYDENNIAGSFHFVVTYHDSETVIDEMISFTSGETLFHALSRTHELTYQDDLGVGKGITKIDGYSSSWTSDYFSLLINGTYATEGTELIILEDQMEVKLVWTKIK